MKKRTQAEDETRHLEMLASVRHIFSALNSAVNLDEVLKLTAKNSLEIVEGKRSVILLLDREKRVIEKSMTAAKEEGWDYSPKEPREDGITWKVVRDGNLVMVGLSDCGDLRIRDDDREKGVKAVVGIPLKTHRDIVGVLVVSSGDPFGFTPFELEALSIFSDQAAIAIKNVKLIDKIEASRKFNEKIIDSIPSALLVLDKNLKIELVNRTYREIRGIKNLKDVVGKNIEEVFSSSLLKQEGLLEAMQKAFESGELWRLYGVRHISSDHSEKILNFTITGIKLAEEEEEEEEALLLLFDDVTERERLAKEIRETRNFLGNLVQSSVDSIIATDRKGAITFVNKVAEDSLGVGKEELIGAHVSDYYGNGMKDAKNIMQILRERGRFQNHEMEFLVRNREKFPVSVSGSLLKDEKGEVIGTLGIFRDLTEEKKLQAQILQSERLASIGRLTAEMAHEILNPLNIISLKSQLMSEKEGLSSDIYQAFGVIKDQIGRVEKVIDNLLVFSRKAEPKMELCSIQELFEETLSLFEHQMSLDNIEIVKDFPSHLPQIEIDKKQMAQVFHNLITNARDAMPDGGFLTISIRLSAKSQQEAAESDFIEISFKDTGSGIPQKNLSKIFDPFFTTKEEGKGTGLGLSVSHGIVETHGGTISVESEVGKGSVFTVKLPLT